MGFNSGFKVLKGIQVWGRDAEGSSITYSYTGRNTSETRL